MKENELPELRCGVCDEVLGIMGLHEDEKGFYVYVMPCKKCRPTPRAADVCHVCGARLPALTKGCVVCGTRG